MRRAVALAGVLIATALFPSESSAGSFLPANLQVMRGGYIEEKFQSMLERHRVFDILPLEAEIMCEAGDGLSCGKLAFYQKIDKARGLSGLAQLKKVNDLFNSIPYVDDGNQHIEDDYWATPEEFLEVNGGDCEEFALSKYLALKQLGWTDDEMRIVVLWDERMKMHHAILLVSHEGEEWVLDNARPVVVQPEHVPHYNPLYVINEKGSWGYAHAASGHYMNNVASH